MSTSVSASVTLFVTIHEPQAVWEHALGIYQQTSPSSDEAEFAELGGTRAEPDLSGCLRIIFDPGESPPGLQIEDSSAELD